MRLKTIVLLALPIFLLTLTVVNPLVYATEERKVLSRNYIGLGVEVYAPYQCYPSDIITISMRVEALENVKNASVTVFIWGSKSEGHIPWGTSSTVLDITDLPSGIVKEEAYNITTPSDIDPGLAYGILYLEWSIYRAPSWQDQWEKANFRATYVKNRDYENLQDKSNQLEIEIRNSRITTYIFLATTIALAVSTVYLVIKRKHTLILSS